MSEKDVQKVRDNILNLTPLSEERKEGMKVAHYTLHLPNTTSKGQLEFISSIARQIIENKPVIIIKEPRTLQFLLRLALQYRNILFEFDEDKRWLDGDEVHFQKLLTEFKPMIEWLQSQYKLKIARREE